MFVLGRKKTEHLQKIFKDIYRDALGIALEV